MNAELAWVILVPFIGAVVASFVGRRAVPWITGLAALATLGASVAVAASVATRGSLEHAVGGWLPPLGIRLRADGLAALLLVTVAVVGALLSVYAIRSLRTDSQHTRSFFSLWLMAWSALNALALSADIFNLYVTLELTTLGAVGLITIDGGRKALQAGLRYLLIALPGSLLYLLGVAILYGNYSTLDLTLLGGRVSHSPSTWAAFAVMTLGLCLKAGLFPLHGWLPPAYASSKSVVAALLSSLIGKGPIVILLRLWFEVFPTGFELRVGPYLGALGAAGVVWGSVLALRQQRLKLLIAYSSVAQVSYLFLVFPMGTAAAWSGAVYLAISHAIAKAAMFLAAGTLERAVGGDDLDRMNGLGRQLPLTFFTLALSGISLMGMPLSGGFIAKWLLLRASIECGQWWWAAVFLLGGLLAAGYVFRILRRALSAAPPKVCFGGVERREELVAFSLALVALLLGVAPSAPLELLSIGGPP